MLTATCSEPVCKFFVCICFKSQARRRVGNLNLERAQCVVMPQEKLPRPKLIDYTYLERAQCVVMPQEKLTRICVQNF